MEEGRWRSLLLMAWAIAGFLLLSSPEVGSVADLPYSGSLCAAKCGTCPVLPPPPPPPPPKKGQPKSSSPPPPPAALAEGQRGSQSYPYYYFYTSSGGLQARRSSAITECLMPLVLSVMVVHLR
ncbi:unnamed protein product [Spirodela intermedia]|uniref:Uncharacterized protein n=1 Tax=Spirodela intermedia TaxID=51605 RepID=A0A7I8JD02_SPIIN|nr:unnamed protein product [Spirodela intermedia]CAA6667979.1 unnamed protein product [Spirodela intermedia]